MSAKKIVFSLVVFLFFVSAVLALDPVSKIKIIGVLGKGIAVLEGDFSNIKIIKVGIAVVRVSILNETTEVKTGVLFLDSDKYRLRNVEFGNGTASADVYLNDTKLGTFTANLVAKPEENLWHGVLKLNDETWHAYIMEGMRKIKAEEQGENVKEECEEHPEKCRELARGIGPNYCDKVEDRSCREKIAEFCKEHPTDQRCVAVFREFCQNNLQDSRCRNELKELCKKDPSDDRCEAFCRQFPRVCGTGVEKECCFDTITRKCFSGSCNLPNQYQIDCDSKRCTAITTTTTTEEETETTTTTETETTTTATNSTGNSSNNTTG